jgi:hypothetical protein
MQNIDCYLIKNITEYLQRHEKVCFKFASKYTYTIFKIFSINIREPSFNNIIPLNIVYWLIDNFKFSKKFQSSCCTKLCFEKEYYKLYECLDNKKFYFDIYFLRNCLVHDTDDIILDYIMSKKKLYSIITIYTAAKMNNKRVLKWCLRNKKLCLRPELFVHIKYDLMHFACATKFDNIITVKYLIKNNFKITALCLKNCIIYNNFKIFRYIINKVKNDLSINFTPTELMNISIENVRLNFMKYLKEIYNVRLCEISVIYDLVKKYKKNNNKNIRNCIEWLLENGKYTLQEDIEIQLIHLGFNL